MKSAASKTLLITFLISTNTLLAQSNNLDGNSYAIELIKVAGNTGGTEWKTDTLKFESGKLFALILGEREGFKKKSYTPTSTNSDTSQIINFSYESYNSGRSHLEIKGKAYGNVIEGTANWTNAQGKRTYSFKGTLLQ